MTTLARQLIEHADDIVARWVSLWHRAFTGPEATRAVIEDSLALQLRLIGEQLGDLEAAQSPTQMWSATERLEPEVWVREGFTIEQLVQEYGLAVEAVQAWVEERGIHVTYREHAYFLRAMFALAAESARRYTGYRTELVRAERADYLAAVMHQLRTPLTALSLQVDLLARSSLGDDPALVKLRRNVRRMHVLVEGVLRLERFEPHQVPLRPRRVHVTQLVSDVMSDFESEARRKGLDYRASVDPDLVMDVDAHLLTDALGNLVHNAVKYTRGGFVRVDVESRGDQVLFQVSDSGPGVPQALRASIEERRTTPAGSSGAGVGMGLRIASHAALALGGSLRLEPQGPEGGSVFSLEVPLRSPEHPEVPRGRPTFEYERSARH